MSDYEKLYEKFMNCNWFEKCGRREEVYENLDYIWAKDIKDVDKNINSIKWGNTCIEEDNELRAFLQINNKKQGQSTFILTISPIKITQNR